MNTRAKLDAIAAIASAEGLQVTFRTREETEGSQAGRTLREIIISAYDEPEPLPEISLFKRWLATNN